MPQNYRPAAATERTKKHEKARAGGHHVGLGEKCKKTFIFVVETKALKRAVRRNDERFPEDFMFELTPEEFNSLKDNLRCQFGTSNIGGIRYMPFAFTEHGVVMLASILHSDIAVQTSILITRAFVAMRQLITNPPLDRLGQLEVEVRKLREYVEEVFADQNDINEDTRMQLELINQTLAELQSGNRDKFIAQRPIGFIK